MRRVGVASLVAAIAALTAAPVIVGGTAAPAARVVLQGMKNPTALAFSPHDGSLWIVDRYIAAGWLDRAIVVTQPGTARQRARTYVDDSAHYMTEPTGIAFSPLYNEFATSALNGGGPTLWTGDLRMFRNGRRSHLDMVHRSEPAFGIAHGADAERREYWVFNGAEGSIDRYFFNQPHELGGMDHTDGRVYRYVPRSLRAVSGVPGHVVYDRASRTVYVADTGNGRIARFRTDGLSLEGRGDPLNGQGVEQLYHVEGGTVETVVEGLRQPSGLALANGHLVVGEYATGRVSVFTLDGRRATSVLTGLGPRALAGIAVAPNGRIYVADVRRGRLWSLTFRFGR
jgi:sugar lactone lactonase YvrE